jgi:hypothetical protein
VGEAISTYHIDYGFHIWSRRNSLTDYFVLTQLIIDDIYFPDGKQKLNQLGGGTYTVAGMRAWSRSVGFCCGLGPDYAGNYDGWFLRNGIDIAGALAGKVRPFAVTYFETASGRALIPGHGSLTEMMPQCTKFPLLSQRKGLYVYKDWRPP